MTSGATGLRGRDAIGANLWALAYVLIGFIQLFIWMAGFVAMVVDWGRFSTVPTFLGLLGWFFLGYPISGVLAAIVIAPMKIISRAMTGPDGKQAIDDFIRRRLVIRGEID